MTTNSPQDTARLHQLLTEALALADSLGQPITAIHISEALDQLAALAAAQR